MSDIKDRLREMADLFEAQQAPGNLVLALRAGADEIHRLRAKAKADCLDYLVVSGQAQDLMEEADRLRAALAKAREQMKWLAENERECLGVVPMDDGTEVPAIFIAVSDIDSAMEGK